MQNKLKKCSKCNNMLPTTYFFKSCKAKDGLCSACKSCQAVKKKEYYEKNKASLLRKQKERYSRLRESIIQKQSVYKLKLKHEKPEVVMWNRAKHRASKYGIFFDITPDDISIPKVCPILQIPLSVNNKSGGHFASPSLDRINPELGYTSGNILVISKLANTMKSNATPAQLLLFAKWVLENVN